MVDEMITKQQLRELLLAAGVPEMQGGIIRTPGFHILFADSPLTITWDDGKSYWDSWERFASQRGGIEQHILPVLQAAGVTSRLTDIAYAVVLEVR
jgi:hypothetical protein